MKLTTMTYASMCFALALSSASAFANGARRPAPTPAPTPAPAPQPSEEEQIAGTRYKTLKDYFDAANTTVVLDDLTHFDALRQNYTPVCMRVTRNSLNDFQFDVALARLSPPRLNAGPLFPAETVDKAILFNTEGYAPSSWVNEQTMSARVWETLSVETLSDRMILRNASSVGSTYVHITELKKVGNAIAFRQSVQSGSASTQVEAYGYCYPKNEQNPQLMR